MTNKQKRHEEFREQLWLIMPHVEKVKYEWKPLQDWIDQQIAEAVKEVVERVRMEKVKLIGGSFYGTAGDLDKKLAFETAYNQAVTDLNAKLDQILKEYGKEQPHDPK